MPDAVKKPKRLCPDCGADNLLTGAKRCRPCAADKIDRDRKINERKRTIRRRKT